MTDIAEFEFNIFDSRYALPLAEDAEEVKEAIGTKERILLISTIAFAKNGFNSSSMRDIARIMGIRPSSLYNHFDSKETLWKEVLAHATNLYTLYFNHLDEMLASASSFESVLETIFSEPKRLANVFTCYAFCLIQAEQFHDRLSGKIFEETFLKYSIEFMRDWFDKCIVRGMVAQFDTQTVATLIMHSVLVGLEVEVHRMLGHLHESAYDPRSMFADVQRFIFWAVARDGAAGGAMDVGASPQSGR